MLASLLISAVAVAPPGETFTPGEWPMFRGPNGQGVGPDPLPADLIRDENLVWRVGVPGRGWASPVVAAAPGGGKTVYVATAAGDGTTQSVLAYDLATGEERWDRLLFRNPDPDFCHPTNTYASCTPVATAEAVFAHFGKYGTARLDPATGHTVWERRDLKCDHFRGPASSPLLVQGEGITPRVVVPFDGVDEQYVVALDAATGETLWRYDRPGLGAFIPDRRKAYGTPVLSEWDGKPIVVTTGANATVALDPANGEPVWRAEHGGMNSGSAPQLLNEILVGIGSGPSALVTTGDAPTALVLLRPGIPSPASGPIEFAPPKVAWESKRAAPRRATPVVYLGNLIWTVDDDGVIAVTVASAGGVGEMLGDDGEVVAQARAGDSFWSSPVAAGPVFAFGKGAAAVAAVAVMDGSDPAATLEIVMSRTTLDEGVWATPALAGGGVVVRTEYTLRFYRPGGGAE